MEYFGTYIFSKFKDDCKLDCAFKGLERCEEPLEFIILFFF